MSPETLEKMKKMQMEMEEAIAKIEVASYTGTSDGIVAIVKGDKALLNLSITNKKIFKKIDLLTLRIIEAVNDANKKIDRDYQEVVSRYQL